MRAVRVARRWQGRLAGTHMAVCGARCGARAAFGLAHRLRDPHRRGRPDLANYFACGRGDLLARGGLLGDGCGDVARRGTEREPLLLACASLLGDGHGGVGAQLDPGPLVDRVPVRLLHVFAVGRLLRARHARRVDAASCRSRPRRCLEVVGAVRVRVARCRSGRPVHSDGARAARVAGRGSRVAWVAWVAGSLALRIGAAPASRSASVPIARSCVLAAASPSRRCARWWRS